MSTRQEKGMDADDQQVRAGHPLAKCLKIAAAAAADCTGVVLGAAGALSLSSTGTGPSPAAT